MKRIMILYASVGGGHFRAADGIKKYIDDNYPGQYQVDLIDGQNYVSKTVDKIVIKSYVNMARYSPKTWSKIYKKGEESHSLASFSNGVQKLLSNKLYELFEEHDPDIVLSTHYFMTEMVACLKRKGKTNCKLAVILTDYASHKFWLSSKEFVDLYFVANEPMKYSLIHSGIPEEKISVTGIPIRPEFLKKYNKEALMEEFDFTLNKPVFLVFGGGQYGMSDSSKLFKGILEVKQDIQIIAIAGKSEDTKKTFEQLASKYNKKVHVYGFTDRVAELMSIADFVVSKPGGLTTTEILVSNVPFIIFNPVPGQEEENSWFLVNNGAGFRMYDLNKTTPFLEQLIDDKFRIENMKIMQKHIAKPNSTKDIVEKVIREIS